MYALTEFTLKELIALELVVSTAIKDKKQNIEAIKKFFPECETKDQLIRNAENRLPELEEIFVRVKTSYQIVNDKQKVIES
jgi:hypothetical protein